MCIFCKIATHEINSYNVYEDDDFYAFLDLSQVTKGHTLLIPKQHSENFLQIEPELLTKMMPVAQKLGQVLVTKLNASGLNIINNCGVSAGQTVMHTHLHLIPRYDEHDQLHIEFKATENPDYEAVIKQLNN